MILKEENDRMYLAYLVCNKHLLRMQFAYSKIQHLFPLTTTTYADLPDETLSFFDQLIFRFTKLQDTMGSKLFRFTLESLAEDGRELPLLDMLARAEQLGILSSAEDWLALRKIRNELTHEYPFDSEDLVEALNQLHQNYQLLVSIWEFTDTFLKKRFGYVFQSQKN
jgi:hypothetical protein